YLTFNRPEARNALDADTLNELNQAIDEAESNEAVKIVVIQGAGDKIFAAGADIKHLNKREPLGALVPGMQGIYNTLEDCSKVSNRSVHVIALTRVHKLTLACDIRIANDKAKFGLPELNLGIIPGAGGTQRLSRIVGKGRALDMIVTGKIVDGEEAERIGLV